MEKVPTSTPNRKAHNAAAWPVRRCLVSGEAGPKDSRVRFVISPSRTVVPDIEETQPGRGMWISAEGSAIERAVQKNLFSKAAKAKALVPPDLRDQVERLLARRCAELCRRARAQGLLSPEDGDVPEETIEKIVHDSPLMGELKRDLSRWRGVRAGNQQRQTEAVS